MEIKYSFFLPLYIKVILEFGDLMGTNLKKFGYPNIREAIKNWLFQEYWETNQKTTLINVISHYAIKISVKYREYKFKLLIWSRDFRISTNQSRNLRIRSRSFLHKKCSMFQYIISLQLLTPSFSSYSLLLFAFARIGVYMLLVLYVHCDKCKCIYFPWLTYLHFWNNSNQ